jgi:hypothetical protein
MSTTFTTTLHEVQALLFPSEHLESELIEALYLKILKMTFLSEKILKKHVHISNDVYFMRKISESEIRWIKGYPKKIKHDKI